MKRNLRRNSAIIAIIAALMLTAALSGCDTMIADETTYTSITDVRTEIEKALRDGKSELTIDMTNSEDELPEMVLNLSPFWGRTTEYNILRKSKDVTRIRFTLEQSDNYYVYKAYTDSSFQIPKSQQHAKEILSKFPEVIAEIDALAAKNSGSPPYALTLAVHDWLVTNLLYDESIDQLSPSNGIYGALIERKTMCLGYAEAMQLILLCRGEYDVELVSGDVSTADGAWAGHAWNIVNLDGKEMHVDATFDDPLGIEGNPVSHIYFGQDDAFMESDHRWNSDYFTGADSDNYYYYRSSGLFLTDSKDFRKTVRATISKNRPSALEVAAEGFEVDEDDLQFIFGIDGVTNVYEYSHISQEDNTTIVGLVLKYDE
jgi:hypothetical protein